jgi:hypothetical protein
MLQLACSYPKIMLLTLIVFYTYQSIFYILHFEKYSRTNEKPV